MKINLTIILILTLSFTYSQEDNRAVTNNDTEKTKADARLELIFNKDKKKLELVRKKIEEQQKKEKEDCTLEENKTDKDEEIIFQRSLELNRNKTYEVVIKGINSAAVNSKIEFNPFFLTSKTPEIIKSLFLGITESSEVKNLLSGEDVPKDSVKDYKLITSLRTIYTESLNKYNMLLELQKKSNELYNSTKFKVCNKKAKDTFEAIISEFEPSEKEKSSFGNDDPKKIKWLNKEVLLHQKYIISGKELFLKFLEKMDYPNELLLRLYSQMELFDAKISVIDYGKYSNFIYKSITAKNETEPVTFSPSKNGVDLDVILVNSYVNDTILKKPFSVYTSGGLSFDFTTGFFYSDLVEKAYFLKGREGDSTKTNIIREKTRNFDVSFGALGHISYRFASSFKAGLSWELPYRL